MHYSGYTSLNIIWYNERVQKSFLHIALGDSYGNYENALSKSKLETLEERRKHLCIKVAKKTTAKHQKHRNWFIPESRPNTISLKEMLRPLLEE